MSLAAHQSIIRKLYCDENMTLGALREYMEREIEIRASKDTYKRWFRKWGLCKNRRGDIWTWASHRIEKRKAGQGNKETEIHFNGTVIDHKRVQKEIARHVSTMDRIEARASSPLTPQGYSIATPLGSTPDLPDTSNSATKHGHKLLAAPRSNNQQPRSLNAPLLMPSEFHRTDLAHSSNHSWSINPAVYLPYSSSSTVINLPPPVGSHFPPYSNDLDASWNDLGVPPETVNPKTLPPIFSHHPDYHY
ncbi:hypothetical protein BO99DRAFT_399027 [Aspergillus violaceofuscus CBS 115571]|uniref:Clr5 domain-containing protein n=1 Tax=Aspergillus violaceofuscus (strain CBS 115571) TaxID=1450538 RepID=A0A2V5HGH5_ASPV1|nr:hypothetical protein BO99DRAFT_399027 [Aspergillus violaceofuscus CBS 115571]